VGAVRLGKDVAARRTSSGCQGFDCTLEYIQSPDSTYSWRSHAEVTGVLHGTSWTAKVFNMTSQRWLKDTDGPVWWHFLAIVTAANASNSSKDWASLLIGQGSNSMKRVGKSNADLNAAVAFAVGTGSIAAVVFQVPNQPMVFKDDRSHRYREEEAMRAWTWKYSIEHTERNDYSLEAANAKAVLRAIDTVSKLTGTSSFIVAGLSKRGLVTWMAAAADARVKAIISGCHELQIRGHVQNSYRSLGGTALAATPYQKELQGVEEQDYGEFLKKIDPYYFFDRLANVNKFVMATGNDDFGLIDHARSWWDALEGSKTYMMRPNVRHQGTWHDDDFLAASVGFAAGVVLHRPLPVINWEFAENGTITAWQVSGPEPEQVLFWTAETCPAWSRRDFRKVTADKGDECDKCGIPLLEVGSRSACFNEYAQWVLAPLEKVEDGGRRLFIGNVKAPSKGWKAGFIDFSFAGSQKATTTVSIMPNTYPFPPCQGRECVSPLVFWSPRDQRLSLEELN